MKLHCTPGELARFSGVANWCSVHRCKNCGILGHVYDLPSYDPCFNCGSKRTFEELVGRWVITKQKVLGIFGREDGYWEIRRDKPLDPKDDINSPEYDPLRKY